MHPPETVSLAVEPQPLIQKNAENNCNFLEICQGDFFFLMVVTFDRLSNLWLDTLWWAAKSRQWSGPSRVPEFWKLLKSFHAN